MIFSALFPVTCDEAGGFMEQLRFGHKCTAALDPYETAFSGQGVQRLPHRGAAEPGAALPARIPWESDCLPDIPD